MDSDIFWHVTAYGFCGGLLGLLFLLIGNTAGKPQTLRSLQKIKFQNRIRRLADMLEKIGVAALIVGLFQHNNQGFWIGGTMLVLSMILTKEGKND